VSDAGGSPFQISEDAARTRMADAGIVLTATDTVLGELAHDWSTPSGAQIRGVLAERLQQTVGRFGLTN
jgi:hypothetical protein